jgi:adenosine deaminase
VSPLEDQELRSRLQRLPKADLHLHLMGALRPTTVVELAWRAGAPVLEEVERGAEEGYDFRDLGDFVRFVIGLFELVLDGETFERVAFEALEDAADRGVRYAELRVTPTSHLSRGANEQAMFAGLLAARRAAFRVHGIESRLVVDFPRSLGLATAERALGVALAHRAEGVTGLDIAGDEGAVAADPVFVPLFRRARQQGLHLAAHAGEARGPESVRGALDLYGVRRIGHGTRSAEDPALLARLAREGVVLEICPSSNLATGAVGSLEELGGILQRFWSHGVRFTINTDGPYLLDTSMRREVDMLRDGLVLAHEQIEQAFRWAREATFVPPPEPATGGAAR